MSSRSTGDIPKYLSLSTRKKGEIIEMDYSEIAYSLVEELRANHAVIDPGVFHLLEPEQDLIAKLLADEYSVEVTYNLLNTSLGRGILLGMLCESIGVYYIQQDDAVRSDSEDLDGH